MSKPLSNIVPTSDTWQSLIDKTNELRFLYSTETMTANATLGVTTGNAQLIGLLMANTFIAFNGVRGGNVTVSNTFIITSAASVNGNIAVSANVTANILAGNTAKVDKITSQSGTGILHQNTVLKDITSNGNIGVGATIVVYRFAKASYSSGELLIQAKNGGTTQTSKLVVATDAGTNASLTAYATVTVPSVANGASPLGTFTANVNNANVEVVFIQTIANTAVSIKAELMV